MPLAAGTLLGPYEILAQIGAGGMGEVYRARDPRLDREVALKISDQQFSGRFEREARAIAALNHPHICTVFDVGPNYLVMELLEGETLAARLRKGPLPADLALQYGAQIADALAAAHAKGITHRDLKPGNVMVTRNGVKVLDFGLAKSGSDETMTVTRAVMGTPRYMAPEQREGRECDARTDIYALGLILREMGADLPPQARRVMEHCLANDPEDRWQAARDVRKALEWTAQSSGAEGPQAARVRPGRLPWAIAAAATLAALAVFFYFRQPRLPAQSLVRLDVDLGSDVSLSSLLGADAILSPDGTRLVYVSHNRLFTRRLDQVQAAEPPGTEGAYAPFFSPDGQWVAFFNRTTLRKVPVTGGVAIVLCTAVFGIGGSWGEDGTIAAALTQTDGLFRIPAGGAPLTELDRAHGEVTHRWPQILPGGKAVLFTGHSRRLGGFDDASIEVMTLRDRRQKTLLRGAAYGRYLSSGHLVYVNGGTLFAVPFDLGALEVRGASTAVLNQVAYDDINGSASFEASRSGTLVYRRGGARGGAVTVQLLESDGTARPLVAKPGAYARPTLSPDGRRLAMEVYDGSNEDLWVFDLGRDTMTRLTFDGKVNQGPFWSPDGRYIVYGGQTGVSWTRSDGAGTPRPLLPSKGLAFPWSLTPDGKRLAFMELDPKTGYDLWTVSLESDGASLRAGKPEVFLQTSADERYPAFSPDGRWLAYVSSDSGNSQVYVRAFPDRGGAWQISSAGGVYPMWSHSGRELFFESLDNRIMVAGYAVNGDSFAPDKPRLWSDKVVANTANFSKNVDLAPDGRRIVAVVPAEGAEGQLQNHAVFLLNFFDELRRRASAGGK